MKYLISSFLRRIGLMTFADKIRFCMEWIKNYKLRKQFLAENPGVVLPPAYFMYETFNLNYYSFYNKSIDAAEWLVSFFKKHKKLENLNILDWGCGPGRVIRHLPSFMDTSCTFFATDYNKKYIKWCSENIPGIKFRLNKLQPPLEFENDSLDIIYGISIFTHLSKEMHFAWFSELMRILKSNGMLFLTLQGEAFKVKLAEAEKKDFDLGNLIVKANTKEGHRTFGAFHPPSFIKELIGKNEILEHVPGIIKEDKPQQDVWIIKKT